jgi:hypothetical protein
MKKFFVVVFVLLLCTISQAQLIRGIGLKAGGTVANQVWDYTGQSFIEPDGKVGLNIGGFVEFLDIPAFSIVGEVNYVQKRAEEELPGTTIENPEVSAGTGIYEFGDDYLNISALAKLRFSMVVIAPYIIAGPKIDFSLNRQIDADFEDDLENARFGFKVGVGTEVDLKVIRLLAEFIYDYDLNKLYEGNNLSIKTNSFDFRIGIYL